MVRRVAEVFVAPNRGKFLSLLALLGVVGCTSSVRLYPGSATFTSHQQLGYAVHSYAGTSIPLSTTSAPAEIPTEKVAEARPNLRDEIPDHVLKHFERTSENSVSLEKTAPLPQPPTPPKSAPNLLADNRLLELLEKDLNKAVEQPKERRRLQFSKEVIDNPKVRHFVKHYSTKVRDYFQTVLARSGKYMPMISKVLIEEGLPEELGYLAIVESELLVHATSQVGAVGLWQFVPATARQYGLRIDQWVDERRDPIKSTRAAAAYLKDLHAYYGRWFLVTAAYNAGPGTIDKALQSSRASDFWGIKTKIREETRNFVPKFIATALIAGDPKKYGFVDIPYQEPLQFEEVEAEGLLRIDALAEMAESDAMTIKELNPALLRSLTPPGEKGYSVRVPVGKSVVFAKANNDLKGKTPVSGNTLTHEVKRGETMVSIARYYGLAVKSLMQLNGLTSQRLKIGQRIKVIFDGVRGTLR
jgi:membrane-bound lytic murein transglycosylase D